MEPVPCLLVDDREENLVALEALLRSDGVRLLKARSGEEALELLLQFEVALALIDVQMPHMDGFELAELMRGADRTRRVPIIFLTAGKADRQRRFRGYGTGAVDFLEKPLDADVLRSKVEVFLELFRQREELRVAATELSRLNGALLDADRRKDEFLATLAHELRNPLAPIRSSLQVMGSIDLNDEAAIQARTVIERQVAHMVRLIDDLMDVARISRGKIELRKEPITVAEVLSHAVESSRFAVDAGGHSLQIEYPSQDIVIQGDFIRLAQVVSNLLTNAAKYTPNGGRIDVAVREEEGQAVITVRDTGEGIRPSMLPRVFELFAQVDETRHRSQGGLGIGLSLVKKLVELHDGSAHAMSEGLGKGSTFTVRLPLAESASLEVEAPTDSPPAQRTVARRRVLVVDDNVDAATTLVMLLAIHGHETRVAHEGREAIIAAQEFRPELIFLDVGLPDLDGYEVCRQLRSSEHLSESTIVAVTGWGSDADKARAKEAGFDHHLVKPVDFVLVESLLNQS